jgi:hypothetical protein
MAKSTKAAEARKSHAIDFLGAILVLVTPFIAFLKLNDYGYLNPESLILILILIGLGGLVAGVMVLGGRAAATVITSILIMMFLDFQLNWPFAWSKLVLVVFLALLAGLWLLGSHRMTVVSAIFGTILVSTLLIPVDRATQETPSPQMTNSARSGDRADNLPIVVHLVLDEHIGVEGIPRDIPGADQIAADLKAFYTRFGFHEFANAYSQFFNSFNSLSQLVNLGSTRLGAHVDYRRNQQWSIDRAEYLRGMAEQGYRISVYQTKYIDFCIDQNVPYAACRTYRYDSLEQLSRYDLAMWDRLRIVATVYANLYTHNSLFYVNIQSLYERLRIQLAAFGWRLPEWTSTGVVVTGPMMAIDALERLRADVANATPGQFLFAHLLLPHSPYLFNADCNLRPIETWWLERRADRLTDFANAAEIRKGHYQEYFQQLTCTYRHLEPLMADIKKSDRNIVVVIQGDHGSRISIANPFVDPVSAMSERDYVDTFSTLFAVRLPGGQAGYDRRPATIVALLKALYERKFRSLPGPEVTSETPTVFLMDEQRRFVRRPIVLEPRP